MRDKKDIGSFFEDKLKDGKRSPDENLWDKINTSLEKNEHKKKSPLLYWLMGLGVLILAGSFLFTNLSRGIKQDSEIPNIHSSLEMPVSNLEETSNIIEAKDSTVHSLANPETSKKKELVEIPDMETVKKEIPQRAKEIVAEAKNKKSSAKSANMDETFNVTTKYYYYNSDDGKEIVTANKSLIDSLLMDQNKNIDSIPSFMRDSQMGQ